MALYNTNPCINCPFAALNRLRIGRHLSLGYARQDGGDAVAVGPTLALDILAPRRQALCVLAHGRLAVHVAFEADPDAAIPQLSSW